MKQIILSATIILCSFTQLAQAESKFDGFYAGVHAGYVDGKDKGKEYDEGVFDDYTQKTSPDSGLFGGFAGFNRVLESNMLIGLEADYEYRGGSDKSLQKEEGVPDEDYPVKTKLKDAASIRARLGYIFNEGQTLGFLTAGYTTANIKRTFYSVGDTPPSESESKWHDGWTLGLGAEHFVNEKMSLKVEYRYSDYGRETVSTAQVFDGDYEERQKYQDEQSIRIGAAYHF